MPDSVLQNYIDGQFVDALSLKSSEPIDLINPRRRIGGGTCSGLQPRGRERRCAAAETCLRVLGRSTPSFRQQALLKLADAIEAHTDEIVDAQCRNTGQPKAVIAAEEVAVSADQIRFFAGAARLVEGKSAGEYMEGFTSYVRREPIGLSDR
ncbi:aldehyde dehydrogenase family protein [Mycobacteroides abscessus]|uniref:aldehyde dehydrogenase family protein n=1 Tax=Mycobacteroides abscessus TaxID=36809 RepID=UPI00044F6E72|nr:aldehyde dehydrogenase family protein [Mycobacteroides abscessus]EUA66029.1 aldehyde dehydrogenase family protein [Mycobacteroides abscessus]